MKWSRIVIFALFASIMLLTSRFMVQPVFAATFTVTNTNDNGVGSLRQAIVNANATAAADIITFNIPAGIEPYTINLLAALPVISKPVTIDATTQPGFFFAPIVVLNGTNAGANTDGLTITAGNTTIKGLVIQNFSRDGIVIQTNTDVVIESCYIGIDFSGSLDRGNGRYGIYVLSSSNRIGGTTPNARNVISGNNNSGIALSGAGASNNQIQGNYIGTDGSGNSAIRNTNHGVVINGASNNTVGGTAAGARNIISGNSSEVGVYILGGGTNNVIEGNYIGSDVTGLTDVGNYYGVYIQDSPNNRIGGTTAAARNVISGNVYGVYLYQDGTTGTLIQGNIIGLGYDGSTLLGNSYGIYVSSNADQTTIGGTTAGARNIIGDNGTGVVLYSTDNLIQNNFIGTDITGTLRRGNNDGIVVSGGTSTIGGTTASARNIISGNFYYGIELSGGTSTIQGNYIGVDVTGNVDLGNNYSGIQIDSNNNIIGGTAAGAGNVISGNSDHGIYLYDTTGNAIQGNIIGLNAARTNAVGNTEMGIYSYYGAGNLIGGTVLAAGNEIAGNGTYGVYVSNGAGNGILYNRIYNNVFRGIDLAPEGVTANDANDSDTGANNLQNYPVITGVSISGNNYAITGTLNSLPSTQFRVQFFSNYACDSSGHGEGQFYLGETPVNSNGSGTGTFSISLPSQPGNFITATATAPGNSTSEFSACFQINTNTPNLIENGDFANSYSEWLTYGTPNNSALQFRLNNGVMEFYRNTNTDSAVVFQNTGEAVPANTPMEVQFSMGNSSSARKRVTVLVHASDFSDLFACSFWIPPSGSTMRTYSIQTHSNLAWSGSSLSFYVSTADSTGWIRLDNVSMRQRPGGNNKETRCIDPLAPIPGAGSDSGNLIGNGTFTNELAPWSVYGQIDGGVSGNVFQFYALPGSPSGSLLQDTTATLPVNAPIEMQFELGNSSAARQRVTILLHARNFSDLAVCAFWVPSNTPLQTYVMRAYTTQAWSTGVSISIYPAAVNAAAWLRMDNIILRHRAGVVTRGVECFEPGTVAAGELVGVGEVAPALIPTLIPAPTFIPYLAPAMPSEQPLIAPPAPPTESTTGEGTVSE
jgi:parallel beta-helix repeat protein